MVRFMFISTRISRLILVVVVSASFYVGSIAFGEIFTYNNYTVEIPHDMLEGISNDELINLLEFATQDHPQGPSGIDSKDVKSSKFLEFGVLDGNVTEFLNSIAEDFGNVTG